MEKVAIVTGSAGYVGSAVAKRLAEEGYRVALFYHTTKPDLVLPGSASFKVDLTNADEVHAVLDKVEESMGPVSLLVHAAGKGPERKALIDTTPESFHQEFAVNALGSFLVLTGVAKRMKERKEGIIIGITSIAAENPAAGKGLGAYVPAKAALRSTLLLLKEELRASNIRVEEIAPGFMEGGMNADLPQAFKEMGKAGNPAGIPASPDEIAREVVRLSV